MPEHSDEPPTDWPPPPSLDYLSAVAWQTQAREEGRRALDVVPAVLNVYDAALDVLATATYPLADDPHGRALADLLAALTAAGVLER